MRDLNHFIVIIQRCFSSYSSYLFMCLNQGFAWLFFRLFDRRIETILLFCDHWLDIVLKELLQNGRLIIIFAQIDLTFDPKVISIIL